MTPLTLRVGSTRPIKYSHRGTVVLMDITVEVVAQIDPIHQCLLDIRWMADVASEAQVDHIDTVLSHLVGEEILDLGNKAFPGQIHLLPWEQWNLSTH